MSADLASWPVMLPLCKQSVETRLGDEVGDNRTRLPAPSLDVRGPLACADIALAGTAAGPDKGRGQDRLGSPMFSSGPTGPCSIGRHRDLRRMAGGLPHGCRTS